MIIDLLTQINFKRGNNLTLNDMECSGKYKGLPFLMILTYPKGLDSPIGVNFKFEIRKPVIDISCC